jgi:hypothetical protein
VSLLTCFDQLLQCSANSQKSILINHSLVGQVRDIREAQVGAPGGDDVEVLIGGTTILTPADMYDLLLGSCYSV